MRYTILALCSLVILASCSSNYSVTLKRYGGFSGIEERYSIDQAGNGTRAMKMPVDTESTKQSYKIDPSLTRQIGDLLHDRWSELSALTLSGTGNMTTGLIVDMGNQHHELTWPNLDPPSVATPALDSLYHLMLNVEQQMTTR